MRGFIIQKLGLDAPDRRQHVYVIVSAFKKIWGSSWGARLEYILYATLAALLQCENTSLLGVSRMLHDDHYRAWVVKQVKDPMVRSFWVNEFANYDRGFRQEVVSPIQNKVGQLFLSPPLRNVLGQVASKINFRFMMDHQRIFIANLSFKLRGLMNVVTLIQPASKRRKTRKIFQTMRTNGSDEI